LLYGDQGAGKTTLCLKVVARLIKSKKYQLAYFFGSTSDEVKHIFGSDKCFDHVDEQVLAVITARQKKRNLNVILIFDDVMCENFHYNKELSGFFSTVRHNRYLCIFSVQHLKGISPIMRRATKHFYALTLTNDVIDYLAERTYYTKKQIRSYIDTYISHKKYFYYCFKNLRD